MFRDSRGVVHTVSSADPLLDLPDLAARALTAALLRPDEPDLETALERCDAVRELVERWQDAFFAQLPTTVDLEEEARWAAEAGLSLAEVEAGYDDADDADDEDEDDPFSGVHIEDDGDLPDLAVVAADPLVAALPEELVGLLERELLLLPLRVRLEALVAAADLAATWADLLVDHEKALGHLVLAHGEPASRADHAALARRHAALHAATGPSHESPPDESPPPGP